MRILFVSTAGHFGGTERWASMAISELAKRGHEIWMACPDVDHADKFTSPDKLFHHVPMSFWDSNGKEKLETFCRNNKIDVLIPISQRAYFPCGQIARKLNIAMVLRLGIVRLPWRPIIDWYGYGIFPDAIIVNTARIKQVLSRAPFVKADRIHVIYNGIVERPTSGIEEDERFFNITSVGTLSWRKGMEHLIKAIALLPMELRSQVRLKLVGQGPAYEKLLSLATRTGLSEQITLTGHVDNPTSHVAASDLFVLLSVQEGISNALLEAMNCGIASYSTLVGGHGEFMRHGENAYVAKSRKPELVARDIAAIMQDEKRAEIGRAGQKTVKATFTLEAMGDKLEKVLLNAIAKNKKV
ncbi:MAG: glycosyltransferase family 4 protein [Anderseniella sp.]